MKNRQQIFFTLARMTLHWPICSALSVLKFFWTISPHTNNPAFVVTLKPPYFLVTLKCLTQLYDIGLSSSAITQSPLPPDIHTNLILFCITLLSSSPFTQATLARDEAFKNKFKVTRAIYFVNYCFKLKVPVTNWFKLIFVCVNNVRFC